MSNVEAWLLPSGSLEVGCAHCKTDRWQTDRQILTDTWRQWRPTLLVADIAAVTRTTGDAGFTRTLTGCLAAVTTERPDQMAVARWNTSTDICTTCSVPASLTAKQNCQLSNPNSKLIFSRFLFTHGAPIWPHLIDWASKCPDVKNYKWRLNPVCRRRMLYSCTNMYMATVGVKGLARDMIRWCRSRARRSIVRTAF